MTCNHTLLKWRNAKYGHCSYASCPNFWGNFSAANGLPLPDLQPNQEETRANGTAND